jgi:hypothetical protein
LCVGLLILHSGTGRQKIRTVGGDPGVYFLGLAMVALTARLGMT